MIEQTKHIIDRFWAGTATEVERQQLQQRITQDEPSWQDALRHEFIQSLDATDQHLTHEQSGRVLMRLHRQILGDQAVKPTVRFWRNWATWAAAAMVVVVAGWLTYQQVGQPDHSPTEVTQQSNKAVWRLTRQSNTSKAVMNVALADGSTLKLQPGSAVSYYEPFGKATRNISLTGTALFTVAKDPDYPFVVLARGFTTTALGTQFWVRATEANKVSVELLEGKVVVRATPASGLSMRDIYLTPGQSFNVHLSTKRVSVDQSGQLSSTNRRATAAAPVASPAVTFTKEPLNNVFAYLGKRYKVQFAYEPADVEGLSFTGSIASTDSLRVVLGAVCTMNDLTFQRDADKVTIRRSP